MKARQWQNYYFLLSIQKKKKIPVFSFPFHLVDLLVSTPWAPKTVVCGRMFNKGLSRVGLKSKSLVAFTDFHGVNTPNTGNIKLLARLY